GASARRWNQQDRSQLAAAACTQVASQLLLQQKASFSHTVATHESSQVGARASPASHTSWAQLAALGSPGSSGSSPPAASVVSGTNSVVRRQLVGSRRVPGATSSWSSGKLAGNSKTCMLRAVLRLSEVTASAFSTT